MHLIINKRRLYLDPLPVLSVSGDFVLQGLDHPQVGQDHLLLAPSVGRGAESAHCGFGLQCKLEVSLQQAPSWELEAPHCGAHAGGIQSVEHPWFSNCFILSGQVLHRVKAFKIQAGNQSLEPGCGLSVSLGVRGDSSFPHKAGPNAQQLLLDTFTFYFALEESN